MTNANANATLATLRAAAEARVATCDIYLNSRALVGQNTVVVSSLTNGRGLQLVQDEEVAGQRMILAMFPKGMPTLLSPKDAATLAEEMNDHLAEDGASERVSTMNHREWWANEKAAAQSTLDFITKNAAALEATAA